MSEFGERAIMAECRFVGRVTAVLAASFDQSKPFPSRRRNDCSCYRLLSLSTAEDEWTTI